MIAIKWSRRLAGNCSEVGWASLLACLVEGATLEPLAVGSKNDTLTIA
jgi:hypothetical protein